MNKRVLGTERNVLGVISFSKACNVKSQSCLGNREKFGAARERGCDVGG